MTLIKGPGTYRRASKQERQLIEAALRKAGAAGLQFEQLVSAVAVRSGMDFAAAESAVRQCWQAGLTSRRDDGSYVLALSRVRKKAA